MSENAQSSLDITRALVKRELAWPDLLKLMRQPKSLSRFEETIQAFQESVAWCQQILLPLGENLFVVAKNGKAIIKTAAGAELCAWNENWKMKCRIIVRRTPADLLSVFSTKHLTIDTDLVELREFYCPVSGTLLDVDCVPPCYPVEVDFTPDLKAFYQGWINKPLPVTL